MQTIKVNRIVYLENTNPGHNKFYQMLMLNNGKMVCAYGKIGNIQGVTAYSERDWYKKLDEKKRKGYVLTQGGNSPEIILNKIGYTLGDSSVDPEKYLRVIKKINDLLANINDLIVKYPNDNKLSELYAGVSDTKNAVVKKQKFSKEQIKYLNELYKHLKEYY